MTPATPTVPPGPPSARLQPSGGLAVLAWPALDALGVDVAVTTRDGGTSTGPYRSLNLGLHVGDDPSAVVENRRRAAAAVGASLDDLVFAAQVHGRTAVAITAADRGRGTVDSADAVADTDALVTAEPGPVLVTLVADCVPIALFDPSARVAAAVHAGWRGTVARVAEAALDAMGRLGARPDRVVAALGPAVSPQRYEVGEEVAVAVADCLGGKTDGVVVPSPGQGTGESPRWLVDLVEANRRLLTAAGVGPGAVHRAGVHTGDDGPFFSDRAARPCGRFGLLVRIRP